MLRSGMGVMDRSGNHESVLMDRGVSLVGVAQGGESGMEDLGGEGFGYM